MGFSGAIVISGATGFVGGLVAAALLDETDLPLILLVRPGRETEGLARRIVDLAISRRRGSLSNTPDSRRLHFFEFPGDDQVGDLVPALQPFNVQEIVHAAGCVDYFATEELERSNVALTQRMIDLGKALDVRRLTFVSTAYSSGYIGDCVEEALHGTPSGGDPTEYTRTKRNAEALIASSGVPWLILRPSIVIGDSRTGSYSGKRYGLYQFWMGIERLLCDRRHSTMHICAPPRPLNFVHQDCLQDAMSMILAQDWTDRIVNIVSDDYVAPKIRELWEMWFETVGRPDSVVYYDTVEEVPLARLHQRQKAFTMFAMVNMKIASHRWRFDRSSLKDLIGRGLHYQDPSLDTVGVCQDWFVGNSKVMQDYISKFRPSIPNKRKNLLLANS